MAKEVIKETRTIKDGEDTGNNGNGGQPSGLTIAERIVYFLGGLLLILLAFRVLLSLLGANRENDFADLIYGMSYPFVEPFFGLFGYEVEYGVSRFEIETVVAMLVYGVIIALIGWAVSLGRSSSAE